AELTSSGDNDDQSTVKPHLGATDQFNPRSQTSCSEEKRQEQNDRQTFKFFSEIANKVTLLRHDDADEKSPEECVNSQPFSYRGGGQNEKQYEGDHILREFFLQPILDFESRQQTSEAENHYQRESDDEY